MTRRLIVEADGGSRGNPGVAGYGSLVRDADTGALLAERAAPLGKESNNVAEYTGLIEGLRAVVDHAPGAAVTVRMDSKLVVEQMSGRWKIKHEDMKRLAAEAQALAAEISSAGGAVTYEWIPRAKNKDADKLSNDGMDGVTVRRDTWGDDVERASQGGGGERTDGAGADVDGASSAGVGAGDPNGGGEVGGEAVVEPDEKPRGPADLGRPTRIVLVRHGVTDFTTRGLLDGRGGADPSLSTEGRDQARRVAGALDGLVGDSDVHVVTSSLARGVETGTLIAERLGVTPRVDADWDEQAFGEWDGLSFKEIRAKDAAGLSKLRHEPTHRAPGGETRDELDERVAAALGRAVERGGVVIIVTHRIVIMSVLAKVLDLSMDGAWRVAAAPASLTGIEVWRDGNAQVAFTNDTHHLRG
ncbi:bifunctional RNase H/acid phosphatase [Dermacoccus nishinomiyaensis]|uniref:bifunctional RNase H/acid phosphatase n=1 Tax=Dermacoccus TaxID=57495 RepID=UPI000938E462|nr:MULTISPECIES: bifunctional RNase H/acid phosphatase [Dermacoccus]TJZ98487.1 bifunctional RNase H/acid phosphatase [Dermacoccus nishinomiyaensis]